MKQWLRPTLTFFPASEASLLPQDGQDSEPSPSAKSTNTARESSPKTSWFPTPAAMDACNITKLRKDSNLLNGGRHSTSLTHLIHHESTQTSSTSTEAPTKAATSSQVDFLASLSALPGSDEARQMTVRSGLKCSALLRKQDPLGCLARTFLESSRWNSTTCYLTWKESATPQGRLLFQLAPWMQSIEETESGSSVETWPTPRSSEIAASATMATVANITNPKGNLEELVFARHFPTPESRDWKYNGKSPAELERNSTTLATIAGGSLNPAWVEWLMGYPLGFTDLKD